MLQFPSWKSSTNLPSPPFSKDRRTFTRITIYTELKSTSNSFLKYALQLTHILFGPAIFPRALATPLAAGWLQSQTNRKGRETTASEFKTYITSCLFEKSPSHPTATHNTVLPILGVEKLHQICQGWQKGQLSFPSRPWSLLLPCIPLSQWPTQGEERRRCEKMR